MPKIINNWKSKIDPCLVKTVTFFLDFVDQLEKSPREGLLGFPEDIDINSLQWHSLYHGEVKEDSLDFLVNIGLITEEPIKKFFKAMQSFDDPKRVIEICSGMVETLPEAESRLFYKKELKRLSEKVQIKDLSDLMDKKTRDFFSVTLSLIVRYLFINIQGEPVTTSPEIENQFIRDHKFISMLISFLSMTFSNIAHQKTLYELMVRLSRGEDKSLFKAVTIDKSFLFHEEVKARIIKAQLTGDSKFFKNLGKAISDTPLRKIGQHGKTHFALSFFWLMGLYKLNSFELYRFLQDCGLVPPSYPYAFEKFIQRHINPVYGY